jgi:hypothetical protein
MSATCIAKLFKIGSSQAVRLPAGLALMSAPSNAKPRCGFFTALMITPPGAWEE